MRILDKCDTCGEYFVEGVCKCPPPYAGVICRNHGHVDIDKQEYIRQMNRPDSRWVCPSCREEAEFDDERFESLQGIGDDDDGE